MILLAFLVSCLVVTSSAWLLGKARRHSSVTPVTSKIAASLLGSCLVFGGNVDLVHAKGGPEGSKTSRKFENCVSQCVFDETKPPPVGSGVDRLEATDQKTAIRICRKKCAKTKAQTMLGTPKSNSALIDTNVKNDR